MAEEYYDPNDRPSGGAPADGSPTPLAGGPLKPAPPHPNGQPWSGPPARPAGNPYQQDQVPVMDGNAAPAPIPTAPAGADATDHVRIGLWGAPRSGKTSFLGALPIAAMQAQRHGQGSWRISGMSREANNFLNDSVTRLSTRRIFPEASVGLRSMSWSVQGEEPPRAACAGAAAGPASSWTSTTRRARCSRRTTRCTRRSPTSSPAPRA